MINSTIEFHDSEVAAIANVGGQVVVFFSHAYMHKSEGRPGRDAGTGWSQAVALMFAEASIEGEVPELPADIWDGDLIVDGDVQHNELPVPFEHVGDVILRLQLDGPAEIAIRGRMALLTLIGEPVYVEDFSPRCARDRASGSEIGP